MQPALEARHRIEQIISEHGPAVVAHFRLDVPPEAWEARLANELGLDAFEEARRRVIAILCDPLDEITG